MKSCVLNKDKNSDGKFSKFLLLIFWFSSIRVRIRSCELDSDPFFLNGYPDPINDTDPKHCNMANLREDPFFSLLDTA